jgi:hypothetical protein
MRSSKFVLCCVTTALLLSSCVDAPEVYQGEVVSYDAGAQVVVVKNERPPQEATAFALAGSEIGADPQPGDQVRLAYVREGTGLRAVRVMNLTRQAEFGKKAKSSPGGH